MFKFEDSPKIKEGIIHLSKKVLRNNRIIEFYTKNPFPNYNNFETVADLRAQAKKNHLINALVENIGFGKKIIEVGSGTSQLSIFLASISNNKIIAFDTTLESLHIGYEFSKKANISNCFFVNGEIFDDPFIKNYFDVVWCSGVLHHTENPMLGFEIITSWLKPRGYIILGLYNYYGRIPTIIRRVIFRILGRGVIARFIISYIDPVLRREISNRKKEAWIEDQYNHPIESLHTLDEALYWFDKNNIEFISSIPSCEANTINYDHIFSKQKKGNKIIRILSQIKMIFSNLSSEGGLFILIGRKKT